uniref:Uncharacterized protein n=1 Tax=Anguilla anguilla TaxID=7936 RepID=A0A0E9V319_ANGAN
MSQAAVCSVGVVFSVWLCNWRLMTGCIVLVTKS